MDVGMHTGQDTAYYLRRGHRVVAVEAEPALVARNRQRFAAAVQSGQLVIEHAAVADHDGVAPFWTFPEKDEWNTLDPVHAHRNIAAGCAWKLSEVPCVRFARLLAAHGTPHYLKINIEGADLLCVRALAAMAARPAYVSLEVSLLETEAAFEALAHLYALGYRRFKLVNQALVPTLPAWRAGEPGYAMGMSGPFGEEAPGAWRPAASIWRRLQHRLRMERLVTGGPRRVRYAWIYNGLTRLPAQHRALRQWRAALTTNSWYDLHAALPDAAGDMEPRE
jgi:FkbM family methyltransferase